MNTSSAPVSVIRETWLSQKPSADAFWLMLCLILSLALGSSLYWIDFLNLSQLMPASAEAVFTRHEYWRLFTGLIAHADIKHLLSNSLLLFVLGFFLSTYFGMILVPLTALSFGMLTNFIVLSNMPTHVQLVGISGVVFWLGGAWLTLYFLLDRRRSLGSRALRTLGVAILLFVPAETFDPGISYQSHFIGFAFGVIWALAFYFYKRKDFRAAEVTEIPVEEPEEKDIISFDSNN